MKKTIAKRFFIEWSLLLPYLALCIMGILMIYSASSYKLMVSGSDPLSKAFNQCISFAISLLLVFIVYHVNLDHMNNKKIATIFLSVTLLLLFVVIIAGRHAGGAQRWISIGFFKFQPSELVPLIIVYYLSVIFSERKFNEPISLRKTKKPLLFCLLLVAVVTLQPNVAGGIMILLVILALLLANGFTPGITAAILIGMIGFRQLSIWIVETTNLSWLPKKFGYLASRFQVMQNPFKDPTGKGFQTSNAYIAMYNGGWFGRGIGNSIQKKGYVPAADTDFIFAICMEELGLVGVLLMLALVFFMVLRFFQLGIKSRNLFHSNLLIGCGTILLLQIGVNVGSILGYIPMTGVTFPFISYGGSSLLILSLVIGLALNICGTEKRQRWEGRNTTK